MTDRDLIIAWAREAHGPITGKWWDMDTAALQRFASLVAAHEREQCARVCDRYEAEHWRGYKSNDPSERANPHTEGLSDGAGECAAAIRGRAEK